MIQHQQTAFKEQVFIRQWSKEKSEHFTKWDYYLIYSIQNFHCFQKHPYSSFCLIVSIQYIWSIQQILHVHQYGNFLDTGLLQDKLSGKIYIVFWRSHLLIYGFLTKCLLRINGDTTTLRGLVGGHGLSCGVGCCLNDACTYYRQGCTERERQIFPPKCLQRCKREREGPWHRLVHLTDWKQGFIFSNL